TIDLSKNPEDAEQVLEVVAETADESDRLKVVIIGNGIAGISCAEALRNKDPECKIDLIGNEVFYSYNRIALERLIHGRTAMDGLFLFEDAWYKQKKLSVWLNTLVTRVNHADKQVELGAGEVIPYDKLVLATGATAFNPPIPGNELPGCFVLRSAKDALDLRGWIQNHDCQRAVVLGGGVLGVEAADAIRMAGVRVTLIERGPHLMANLLDAKAGRLLSGYLEGLGIDTLVESGVEAIGGTDCISQVTLKDGSTLNTQLLVVCAGIRPNTGLAEELGLEINRGVVVNEAMETSDKDIFAVGDVAELPGALGGLWSVANEHGKVAAASIVGEPVKYRADAPPPVQLKVPGISLCSFSRIKAEEGEEQLTYENEQLHQWMSMVVKDNRVVGGVFVNLPTEAKTALNLAWNNLDAEDFILEVTNKSKVS
uniref:NAD(P)/FAD-dependent oxidoreductase n=1 Tax=Idiomarina abyssalis TaxID=86102 RepID=UPI003A91D634